MADAASRTIRIAAALIDDGDGRLLLVRKAGLPWFMQAGVQIEENESAFAALRRELAEAIGLALRAPGVNSPPPDQYSKSRAGV